MEISIWWWEESRLLFAGVSNVWCYWSCGFLASCDLWKDSQAPSLHKGLLSHPGYPLEYKCHHFISVLCQNKHNQLCWMWQKSWFISLGSGVQSERRGENRGGTSCAAHSTASLGKHQFLLLNTRGKRPLCAPFFSADVLMWLNSWCCREILPSKPPRPGKSGTSRLHFSRISETRSPLTCKSLFPLHGALPLGVEYLLFIIWHSNRQKYRPWHLGQPWESDAGVSAAYTLSFDFCSQLFLGCWWEFRRLVWYL